METSHAEESTTTEHFDQLFDSGSDEIDRFIDWSKARRPGREVQRVNVDFPVDLLREIDAESDRIGVTRQAFIKMRIADSLRPDYRPSQSGLETEMAMSPDARSRLVRLRKLCVSLNIPAPEIVLRFVSEAGDFPKPSRGGSGREVWVTRDVEEWLLSRLRGPWSKPDASKVVITGARKRRAR